MNNHASNGVFEVGKNAKKEYRREKEGEKKKKKKIHASNIFWN